MLLNEHSETSPKDRTLYCLFTSSEARSPGRRVGCEHCSFLHQLLALIIFPLPHHGIAALLHDVLDKKYVPAEVAADPYSFFAPLFATIATKSDIDLQSDGRGHLISRVVENVSWTTEKKLRQSSNWSEWHQTCLELHCVQDADRLDAIGAFGKLFRVRRHATKAPRLILLFLLCCRNPEMCGFYSFPKRVS